LKLHSENYLANDYHRERQKTIIEFASTQEAFEITQKCETTVLKLSQAPIFDDQCSNLTNGYLPFTSYLIPMKYILCQTDLKKDHIPSDANYAQVFILLFVRSHGVSLGEKNLPVPVEKQACEMYIALQQKFRIKIGSEEYGKFLTRVADDVSKIPELLEILRKIASLWGISKSNENTPRLEDENELTEKQILGEISSNKEPDITSESKAHRSKNEVLRLLSHICGDILDSVVDYLFAGIVNLETNLKFWDRLLLTNFDDLSPLCCCFTLACLKQFPFESCKSNSSLRRQCFEVAPHIHHSAFFELLDTYFPKEVERKIDYSQCLQEPTVPKLECVMTPTVELQPHIISQKAESPEEKIEDTAPIPSEDSDNINEPTEEKPTEPPPTEEAVELPAEVSPEKNLDKTESPNPIEEPPVLDNEIKEIEKVAELSKVKEVDDDKQIVEIFFQRSANTLLDAIFEVYEPLTQTLEEEDKVAEFMNSATIHLLEAIKTVYEPIATKRES